MSLTGAGAAGRHRVVVLDDSPTVLATVRLGFERAGLTVQTARDASELNPEDLHSASLIVVDVQMEHVFGDDVVQFLRESWQVQTPIYLYSSLPKSELERRAERSGASGAVCKSEGVAALVAQARKVLEGA